MPLLSRMMLAKLPVADLSASVAFFRAIGFGFMDSITTEEYALLVVNDGAGVLLMVRDAFAEFTPRGVADAKQVSETLIVVPGQTREQVDGFAEAARAAGAPYVGGPGGDDDRYGRRIADLDGHLWEMVWERAELARIARPTADGGTPESVSPAVSRA